MVSFLNRYYIIIITLSLISWIKRHIFAVECLLDRDAKFGEILSEFDVDITENI